MTNSNSMLRQTIYYPYSWALQFARGSVLSLLVDSPGYEVSEWARFLTLTWPEPETRTSGKVALFVLNRDLSRAHAVEINWQDQAPARHCLQSC